MKSNQTNNRATAYGRWLICASFILLGALNLRATDGTWTSTANGNWSDTTKWSGGTVADGANGLGSTAFFNTLDLLASVTVTLDTERTNGILVFADTDPSTAAGWVLGGSRLTLAGPSPTIVVSNLAVGNSATISAPLAGKGFIKKGDSVLILSAVNTNAFDRLDEGTVVFGNASALGTSTNNSLIFNGGALNFPSAAQNFSLTNTSVLTTGTIVATNGNYDTYMANGGRFVGDANSTLFIFSNGRFTPGGTGGSSADMFKDFLGTVDLTNSTSANTVRVNMGATNIYDLSTVTLNPGTNAGRFQWRTTTAGSVVRIGALTGTGGGGRLAASEQAGNPLLTWFIGYKNLNTTFAGVIQDTDGTRRGALVKVGTGTLTLYGANSTYTGPTTISNGVLALSNSVALTGTPSITVANPGIFDVSGLTNGSPSGLPNSGWSLRSIGGIPQVLAGDGTVVGQVILTNGIVMPGSNAVATLTFNNDLTLGGTNNDLSLPLLGARIRLDLVSPAASDKIAVSGNLNLSGSNVVEIIPSAGNVIVTNGTYVLFQWAGGLTGDLTNLYLSMPSQLGTATLTTNATKQIVLTVAGAQLIDLTWRGDQGPDWSTANNWRDTNGSPATWANGRVAHFDESSVVKNVTISTSVSPARTLFSNTSTYDFTGGGKITGAGVMVKDGIGLVIFETGNDYSGSTTISNGVIQIGNNNTSGSLGSGPLIDNGAIAFNRADGVIYGASISGTGGMIVGAGTVTLTTSSSYTGLTVVSNSAVLQLGTGLPVNNGSLLSTIQVNSNATVHYFFDANAQTVNNSLTGSGAVIYEINQGGTPTGPRTILFGGTVTNTGFVGFVDIKGGTRLEIPTAAGMLGTNILVEYDSTFNVGGAIYAHGGAVTNTATLSIIGQGPGTGVDTPRGMGALRLNNGWSGNITLGGPDTFGNPTSIGGASGTGTIIGNISDNGNNYMLEYFNGAINVGPASGVNSYGATRISEGRSGAAPGTSAATTVMAINSNALSTNGLEMSGQAVFRLNGNNITVANLNSRSGDNTDASIICSNYIPVIQNFSTTTSATLTVGVDGNSQQFDGIFGDGASQPLGLTKVGAGTLTLSGDSTNHGVVTVSQGTLALISADAIAYNGVLPKHGSGSFSNATQIAIASGATLDVTGRADNSGTLTLQNGQTLKGNGTLNGKLIASAGSIINPGSSVGTLTVSGNVTLNGTLWLELNRTNSPLTYDRLLSSGGSITYGGTLLATNIGPVLQTNDTFQLFPSGNAGFALKTLVTTDANGVIYTWQDNINTLGSIKVVGISPGVNTTPTNITFKVNGGNLELSWPADHTGWTLQSQTNSTSIGLTTNWVDMNGSAAVNSVTNAVNAGNGAVFYRMKYP